MQSYWYIQCYKCNTGLRLPITDERQLGRRVEISCPLCQAETPTIIGVSGGDFEPVVYEDGLDSLPASVKEDLRLIVATLKADLDILEAQKRIMEAGYLPGFALSIMGPPFDEKPRDPKVSSDGEVEFSPEDMTEFRRIFNSDL